MPSALPGRRLLDLCPPSGAYRPHLMTSAVTPLRGPFFRIALWQTAFLGDAVLTLPLARALARAWPGAEIHFHVRGGLEGLFAAQPEFASVTGVYKHGRDAGLPGAWRLGRTLAAKGCDLLVSAHKSFRSALVALASGIPARLGYDEPFYNRLAYSLTAPRRFAELDEIERLLELARALGITELDPWPRLVLPENATAEASRLLSDLPGPVVGLHPGSVWPTKRWPANHFSRLADLALEAGASVALFAGPGEEATAAEVRRGMHGKDASRLLDLSGTLSLPLLAAVIGRLDAYVTGDSGPMHLSWAQGTPTLAIFGPTVKSLGFFPRGAHSRVLQTALPCRPCGLHGPQKCPKGHHRCMTDISPEAAWNAASDLLAKGRGTLPKETA